MLSFFGWGSSSKSDSNTLNSKDLKPSSIEQDGLSSSIPSSSAPPPQQTVQPTQLSATKANTNLKLMLGGMVFVTLSVYITRRASIRKRIACIPPFYSSSIYFQPKANGAMEAFEALNLATINVFSFAIMATGGVMYALDVNGIEDMRRLMRGGLENAAAGKSDEELEQDITEWVASVLGDRFEKQLEKERAKKRESAEQNQEKTDN
ncbi:hypothetical protein N7462_001716 [Penicillium macrosclerotiorum]|uniref:uncharacterized protein n=1 Tax=Penicillium macrosclerotiorum TaxID=303699 RepID=UPI002547E5AA|nr:uncharacterized protein N7462_001716 [Penicillium macrosclerotiorum]KAJ5692293.1 hypothetical protein N7462_001716 [Penicillium macrosclerotiorum]